MFVGIDNAHDELRNENTAWQSWFALIIHVERERMDRRESEGDREGVEGEVGKDFSSNH